MKIKPKIDKFDGIIKTNNRYMQEMIRSMAAKVMMTLLAGWMQTYAVMV